MPWKRSAENLILLVALCCYRLWSCDLSSRLCSRLGTAIESDWIVMSLDTNYRFHRKNVAWPEEWSDGGSQPIHVVVVRVSNRLRWLRMIVREFHGEMNACLSQRRATMKKKAPSHNSFLAAGAGPPGWQTCDSLTPSRLPVGSRLMISWSPTRRRRRRQVGARNQPDAMIDIESTSRFHVPEKF